MVRVSFLCLFSETHIVLSNTFMQVRFVEFVINYYLCILLYSKENRRLVCTHTPIKDKGNRICH